MPYVDLPAHNVNGALEGTPHTEVVGGPECLATTDPDSYVRFSWDARASIYIGNGGGDLGFGVWEQPPGTVVTDIRFVALGYREPSGAGDFPQDDYGEIENTDMPVETYPFLYVHYNGDPFFFGGYNLSQFPIGTPGWSAPPTQINLQGFCIAPGQPDQFENGLGPGVYMATYPFPLLMDQAIVLIYMAVRITYTYQPLGRLRVMVDPGASLLTERWKFAAPVAGENEGFGWLKVRTEAGWVKCRNYADSGSDEAGQLRVRVVDTSDGEIRDRWWYA